MAVLVAGAGALAWAGGSIRAVHWLGFAVLAALLGAAVLVSGGARRPARAPAAAVALLLGFAAWSALSALWSPVPALARDDALLGSLYAIAMLVPLLTLRGPTDRLFALGAVAAGAIALALAELVELATADDAGPLYIGGRLAAPVGYPNAQAAACLVGFWPAVALAARRSAPVVVRALSLAGASALLAGWLLSQSKGAGIALAVSAVVFLALAAQRLRALVPIALTGALALSSTSVFTEPFRHRDDADFTEVVNAAGRRGIWVVALAAAAGLVYALVDRRLALSARTTRLIGWATLALAACAAAAAVAVVAVRVDHPGRSLEDKWEAFKTLPEAEQGASHFVNLGSNRYDFWRVALDEFRDHPLAGIGARGFETEYTLRGRSHETPARAHSLELDALSETGLVGGALLAAALACAVLPAFRRARRGLTAAALAAAAAYWLVHVSGDWVWTFPALGVPFFALLGIAASVDEPPLLRPAVAIAGGVAAAALALGAYAPPWLAGKFVEQAIETPATRADDLRRARRLDPLSVDPLLVQAALAERPRDAIPPLREVLAREPRVPSSHYLLGLAYLDAGRKPDARRELLAAARLAPRDRLIARTLRRVG